MTTRCCQEAVVSLVSTMQEYVRALLVDRAGRPSVEAVVARARSRVEATGTRLDAAPILAERDAERR